jgi:hypothetical protein
LSHAQQDQVRTVLSTELAAAYLGKVSLYQLNYSRVRPKAKSPSQWTGFSGIFGGLGRTGYQNT